MRLKSNYDNSIMFTAMNCFTLIPFPESYASYCWTGPGHQWVQPVRSRDPPRAGGQEEACWRAETETYCLQRTALSLQVSSSLLPRPVTLCCNQCCHFLNTCLKIQCMADRASQTEVQSMLVTRLCTIWKINLPRIVLSFSSNAVTFLNSNDTRLVNPRYAHTKTATWCGR